MKRRSERERERERERAFSISRWQEEQDEDVEENGKVGLIEKESRSVTQVRERDDLIFTHEWQLSENLNQIRFKPVSTSSRSSQHMEWNTNEEGVDVSDGGGGTLVSVLPSQPQDQAFESFV